MTRSSSLVLALSRLAPALLAFALCAVPAASHAASASTAQDPPQEPAPHAAPAFDPAALPARLRPAADDVPMRHGMALLRAREGDLDGALAALEGLLARCGEDELAARLARDAERVREFRELRLRFLTQLAEQKGRLRLDHDGRELRFDVERLEDDRLVFQNSREGIASLPLAELDSLKLAQQMSRKLPDAERRWVRVFPFVLAGHESWGTLLKRDGKGSEDAELLRADAETWYAQVLRLGEVGAVLEELADRGAPVDEASATASLALVEGLLDRHADLDAVRAREDCLSALALGCLEKVFRLEDVLAELGGRVERRTDGTVHLTYRFDEAVELEDFQPAPGYPAERLALLPQLATSAEKGVFEVRDGKLELVGSQSWRHALPFQGPITVRFRLQVGIAPAGGSSACFWMLGACDDGQESYVALQELGTAIAIDKPSAFVAYAAVAAGTRLSQQKTYQLELVLADGMLRTRVDGELVKEISAGERARGAVFLLVHSDAPVLIDQLEIEGTPCALEGCRRWMSERLVRLGLPQASAAAPLESDDGALVSGR